MNRILGAGCLLLAVGIHAPAQVRAWQDSITLPTYKEGPPDAFPVMDALSPGSLRYPYASRTNLTTQKEPAIWRRLNLENEYLRCAFLPDLGGRLYTCTDKRNGHAIFRANPTIKKAPDMAVRGAAASSGLIAVFPVGHSRDNVSPASFGVRQEKDRAIVWVGDVDRTTGLERVTEFILRPGSAVLEETTDLRNSTSVRQPFYWWSDGAVEVEPGTRFIYPAHVMANHGQTELDSWPISSSGVDQSVVANDKAQLGLFAYGCREPFMAVYHAGSRTATVHYADPAVMPGKKLWTFGTDRDQFWRDMFSDDNRQFVELQAGLFENQSVFHFLEPHQSVHFTEYWMPAMELGGISRANPHAILNFERRRAGAQLVLAAELNVTHAIPGAQIRILDGARAVLNETVDLDPSSVVSRSIPDPKPGVAYRFELRDRAGTLLLAHGEGPYDAVSPAEVKLGPQPQTDWSHPATESDFVAKGELDEQYSRFRTAETDYRAGLEKFPASTPLKKAAGRLAVSRRRFQDGVTLLAALTGDAEASYYLAAANAALGKEDEARKLWEGVLKDAVFGPAAAVEMAASLSRSGQPDAALAMTSDGLRRKPGLLRAGRLQVALLRRSGKEDAARAQAADWLAVDPLDSFLRLERIRLGQPDEELWRYLAADPERLLDIASQYLEFGFYADALPALERIYTKVAENQSEPGAVLPQAYPLVAYYRGYCRAKTGGSGLPDYQAAAAMSLNYVFPNRASSIPVLRDALKDNPSDASARWLLGLLDLDSDLVENAIAEFQQVRSKSRNVPALHLVLGQALLLGKNNAAAGAVFKEGLEVGPQNAALRQNLEKMGLTAPPLRTTDPGVPAGNPDEIAEQALMQAANGNLDAALQAFNDRNFPQAKQSNGVRQAYLEIQLQRLRRAAADRQCSWVDQALTALDTEDKRVPFTMYGFGPFEKGARFQYYLGTIEAACGDEKSARRRWAKTAKTTADPETADFAFPALSAARLNEGDGKAAMEAAAAAAGHLLASAAPDSKGLLLFSQGVLLRALGQDLPALNVWEQGTRTPNRNLSLYLNSQAIHEAHTAAPAK